MYYQVSYLALDFFILSKCRVRYFTNFAQNMKIRTAFSEVLWSHCVIEEVISGNFDFYFSQLGFMFTWST
jgi:hypothetical protein